MKSFVPREARRPVGLRGFARSATRDLDIVVTNLSYGGCQIESAETLTPGEVLELLIIKRGSVMAEVRWSAAKQAGLSLEGCA